MKEAYKTLVKVYTYKGNEYVITKGLHDGIIRAINYKYIDEDGKLTKPLNGFEMFCDHYRNTVNDIIRRINLKHDYDEFIENSGIDKEDTETFLKATVEFFKNHE